MSRAATLLGVVVLLSATVVAVEAAADENKEGRKKNKKGIFGKLMERNRHDGIANGDANGGAILAEDEGYWERFLQATIDSIPSASPSAPPTPGPECDVTVRSNIDATQNLSFNQCAMVSSLLVIPINTRLPNIIIISLSFQLRETK